jgi:glycosyltransferase involved in cell wall biosynthesis
VILNGVAPHSRPDIRRSDPPALLFVGRLSVQKNPLALVKVAEQIRDLPWKMHIVGEGPFSSELRDAIETANLKDRIFLHGWKSAQGVREQMLDSDILLMPSLSEGLPMAAIEALHCGLAIVGSRIPGLRDVVIPGRNGELCDPSDLESTMASALRNLLANPDLLMARRRESLVLSANFDLAKSTQAYEEVLQRAAFPAA